jgi:hypothetical protein
VASGDRPQSVYSVEKPESSVATISAASGYSVGEGQQ